MVHGFVFAGKCVVRAVKAFGHAYWEHNMEMGYLMAKSYLPDDETQNMVDPLAEEYAKDHADA